MKKLTLNLNKEKKYLNVDDVSVFLIEDLSVDSTCGLTIKLPKLKPKAKFSLVKIKINFVMTSNFSVLVTDNDSIVFAKPDYNNSFEKTLLIDKIENNEYQLNVVIENSSIKIVSVELHYFGNTEENKYTNNELSTNFTQVVGLQANNGVKWCNRYNMDVSRRCYDVNCTCFPSI
jgi:hypothetical protein